MVPLLRTEYWNFFFEGFPYHLEYLLPYLNIFVQCCQNIFFVDKNICEGCVLRHSVAGPRLIKLADQRGLFYCCPFYLSHHYCHCNWEKKGFLFWGGNLGEVLKEFWWVGIIDQTFATWNWWKRQMINHDSTQHWKEGWVWTVKCLLLQSIYHHKCSTCTAYRSESSIKNLVVQNNSWIILFHLILGRIRSHGSEHCQLNLPDSSCPQLPIVGMSHHHHLHPQSEKSIWFEFSTSLIQSLLKLGNLDLEKNEVRF